MRLSLFLGVLFTCTLSTFISRVKGAPVTLLHNDDSLREETVSLSNANTMFSSSATTIPAQFTDLDEAVMNGHLNKCLSAKDVATLRSTAKPFAALDVRLEELYIQYHPGCHPANPYLLYRFCIQNHQDLPSPFGPTLPSCLDIVNHAYLSAGNSDSTLTTVLIQTIYDISADRIENLSLSSQSDIVNYLMDGASVWTSDQRHAVLFHLMRNGVRTGPGQFTLPLTAWSRLCSGHFDPQNDLRKNTLVPIHECLKAAAALAASSQSNHNDILQLLNILEYNQHILYFSELEQYHLTLFNCKNVVFRGRNLAKLPALFDKGLDVNVHVFDLTPLLLATEMNREDIARLLLDKGADPNIDNHHQHPRLAPLMIAVLNRNRPLASLLLTRGADPNTRNDWKSTVLMEAVRLNDMDMVSLLLDHGANPNAVNMGRTFALRNAIIPAHFTKKLDVICLLIKRGANPNMEGDRACTALCDAILFGDLDIVKVLLENGADPAAQDESNQSAVDRAEKAGHLEIAQLLRHFIALRSQNQPNKRLNSMNLLKGL